MNSNCLDITKETSKDGERVLVYDDEHGDEFELDVVLPYEPDKLRVEFCIRLPEEHLK